MPSTTTKIQKTKSPAKVSTSRGASKPTLRKPTPKSTVKSQKKSTTSTAKQQTASDRIKSLEETVDKLLNILDTEFRTELKMGPKQLSTKLRKAGLVKKN